MVDSAKKKCFMSTFQALSLHNTQHNLYPKNGSIPVHSFVSMVFWIHEMIGENPSNNVFVVDVGCIIWQQPQIPIKKRLIEKNERNSGELIVPHKKSKWIDSMVREKGHYILSSIWTIKKKRAIIWIIESVILPLKVSNFFFFIFDWECYPFLAEKKQKKKTRHAKNKIIPSQCVCVRVCVSCYKFTHNSHSAV